MAARLARLLLFYGLLLLAWQALVMTGFWPSFLFPSPGSVGEQLARNLENGLILEGLVSSMRRLAIGFALAFGIGAATGALTGRVRWADETLGTLVVGLQSLPSICWLPLALLWFGLSDRAIVFVVLMGSAFSIAIAVREGIRGIPPLYMRAAATYGASRWQLYHLVLLPGMLPSLAGGLKQGWSFAWRSLMAGELLFVTIGLGHLLNIGRELNNMGMVVAIMIVIVLVGVAVDRLIFGRLDAWVRERWGLVAW